jgi:2-methylcitrate dehydratase
MADAFSFEALSLHHVSAAGFVAPLVMSKLWGLPRAQTAHAAALGGFRHLTHAALVRGELSMAKALGYASAASECVLSTRLAAQGYTGPTGILESLGVGEMNLDPGTDCVTRVSLKQYPVQYSLQAPIEAALELRSQLSQASSIRELRIEMPPDACRRTADPAKFAPSSRETADHSLPCCVAMALADGHLDHRQFEVGRWRENDVRALIATMRIEPSEELEKQWPDGRPMRLTAVLEDGSRRSAMVPVPLGDSTRPMSDEAVLTKFLGLAEPVLGPRAAKVAEAVGRLEEMDDTRELCSLLAPQA